MKKFIHIFKGSRLILTAGILLVLCAQLHAEILPGNNDFDSYLPMINGRRVAIFTNISGTLTPYSDMADDESLPESPTYSMHCLNAE